MIPAAPHPAIRDEEPNWGEQNCAVRSHPNASLSNAFFIRPLSSKVTIEDVADEDKEYDEHLSVESTQIYIYGA